MKDFATILICTLTLYAMGYLLFDYTDLGGYLVDTIKHAVGQQ